MTPTELPHLADIFKQLGRGRHICREDGEHYWALERHRGEYEEVFAALGFHLQFHARGFFFFKGEGALSKQASRMALFFFILVEWMADRGDSVERQLLDGETSVLELPHLRSERYRALMREIEVTTAHDLIDVLRNFERFGFAQWLDDQRFRFRAPISRFFDLCHALEASTSHREETARRDVRDAQTFPGEDS